MKSRYLLYAFVGFSLNNFAQILQRDQSFGINGVVELEAGVNYTYESKKIVELPDGTILMAATAFEGAASPRIMISKLLPSGQPDISFSTDGVTVGNMGMTSPQVSDLKVQPDGKILVAGHHLGGTSPGNHDNLFILRFLPDGSLDNSFASGGKFDYDQGGRFEQMQQILIQEDGKILFSAHQQDYASGPTNNIIGRLEPDGSFDLSFNTTGTKKFTTNFVNGYIKTALNVDGNGRIILAFSGENSFTSIDSVQVRRINSDGTSDNSFSTDGLLSFKNGISYDYVGDILIDNEGGIIISAMSEYPDAEDLSLTLTKITTTGQISSDFGNQGVSSISTGFDPNVSVFSPEALVLSPNDEIIVGFQRKFYFDPELTTSHLAVLDLDGNLKSTFDSDGIFQENEGGNALFISDFIIRESGAWTLLLTNGNLTSPDPANVMIIQYKQGYLYVPTEQIENSLYPNPTQGAFNLFIAHPEQVLGITILDPSGKVVQTYNGPISSHIQLDLSALARGTYFVQVAHAESCTIQQLILN